MVILAKRPKFVKFITFNSKWQIKSFEMGKQILKLHLIICEEICEEQPH
jgi:hypothetical protein